MKIFGSNSKQVGVCITPELIHQFDFKDSIAVVIDVLRATTSMCVALDYGANSIIPVVSIEECLSYQKEGFLAAAERQGEQIEGMDFGNSPYSFMNAQIIGNRDIVMSTTNGTQTIEAARKMGAEEILVASFANISVLVKYLKNKDKNVLLICAGWQGKPNLEDTIFAGAVVNKLRSHFRLYEDAALIAETLFRSANRRKRYFLRNSSHYNRTLHLRIQKDVKYALRKDTHPVIPILNEGRLVSLEKLEKGEVLPLIKKIRPENTEKGKIPAGNNS